MVSDINFVQSIVDQIGNSERVANAKTEEKK